MSARDKAMPAATDSHDRTIPDRLRYAAEALSAPFYRFIGGAAALFLWAVAMTRWWNFEAGYDIWFWTWLLALFALWLSPRLPDAKPADVGLTLVWAAAVTLRCWGLFTMPSDPGDPLSSETIGPVLTIESVYASIEAGTHPNVFQSRWGVYLAPNYIAYTITWDYLTAFRSVAAAWDALALAGLGLLARRIGAAPLAYAALVLVGMNWWDNTSARMHPIMSAACGAAWTWWAVLRACSTRHASDAVLAGVILSLALRLYEPVKVLVVIVPLWWLYHAVVTRTFLRTTWRQAILIGATTLMGLWPMLSHGGTTYFFEAQSNAMLMGQHLHGEFEAAPLRHMSRIFHLFTGERVDTLVNLFVDIPILNAIEFVLLIIGLVTALQRWRDPTATVAPIWFGATCLAVAVSSQPEAARRLTVALPAIGILAAGGLLLIVRQHRWWGLAACAVILVADAHFNWQAFHHWVAVANR
jgi:hypothetical protein